MVSKVVILKNSIVNNTYISLFLMLYIVFFLFRLFFVFLDIFYAVSLTSTNYIYRVGQKSCYKILCQF